LVQIITLVVKFTSNKFDSNNNNNNQLVWAFQQENDQFIMDVVMELNTYTKQNTVSINSFENTCHASPSPMSPIMPELT
jgi:hypothetical protein